jgi:hypothetical protein
MKTRLQALALLDRAIRATSDEELTAAVEALDDDHREALERVVEGEPTPTALREAATKGRLNGVMEGVALVLTEASLNDCIEKLGDHSDNPTSEQLREVLPGVVERHGLALTRMMLASTLAGEAAASAVIRDLLRHDELVKLPREEPRPVAPPVDADDDSDPEREALKAKRHEARKRKQEEAARRREQSARDRNRA